MAEEVVVEGGFDASSTPHMIAKVIIGALACFAVGKLTDKAYDSAAIAIHNRRNGSSE